MTDRPQLPTKEQTLLLQPFEGITLDRVFVVSTNQGAVKARAELADATVLGFDTESKPIFRRGEVSDGPHVVQFSLPNKAYVFQLQQPECRSLVADLLSSPSVLKVGFGLGEDRRQITNKLGVRIQEVLDIDTIFRQRGYAKNIGVKAAIALLFNRRFSKSKKMSTSNWANTRLSDGQVLYAANDAYAAIQVFQALDLTSTPAPQTPQTNP